MSSEIDLIVRRELVREREATGFSLIINLSRSNFLKRIGAFLVDIHGQGEQATLF